jgi:hypothetical protein
VCRGHLHPVSTEDALEVHVAGLCWPLRSGVSA